MDKSLDGTRVILLSREEERAVEKREKKRKGTRIAVGVLLPLVVLVVLFSVLLNARDLGVGQGNTDGAYGTVLADIDGIREADPRIIDIAMLGAHDANSFSVSADGPVDDSPSSEVLGALLPLSSGFQYRMSVTQTLSPHGLLMQGARFLHLKYTYYDGEWRATHSLVGRPFEEDVLEVLEFLHSHPGEVVLLLFQCSYFGETQSLHTFHDWLAGVRHEGKNIYDYVRYDKVNVFGSSESDGADIAALTYNGVTSNGSKAGAVLFDRREHDKVKEGETAESEYSQYFFDIDSNARHTWHSRMGSDALIGLIEEEVRDVVAARFFEDRLRVDQTQASVAFSGISDIFHDIFSWSLLKFAEEHNAALIEHPDLDEWLRAMPVFQVDFVNSEKGDFNRRINEKIRARNEEIVRILLEEEGGYEALYR